MASLATLWLSATDKYETFEEGYNADNSFSISIPTTNEFRWVEGTESLLVGTAGEEWRVYSEKTDSGLTPTSYKIIMQSGFGSNIVQPVIANSVILFCDTNGRRLHELTWDDLRQKFLAPDMSVLAEHITKTGIVCMALQKYPDMIVWCVLTDGSLISFTYNREQNVIAWADHTMIDVTVKSVCVTPNSTTNEDEITITAERMINSVAKTYIEKFSARELPASIADCYFVDCGITYSGAETGTITGLSHLVGETVSVFGSGGTSGTYTVYEELVVASNGSVTLPTVLTVQQTVTKAQVGKPYTYELQPMRLDIGQGSVLGSKKKIPEIVVSLQDSAEVKYGDSSTTLKEIDITTVDLINKSSVTGLYTGDISLHFDGGFSVDDSIIISGSKPLPCTVRCLIPKVEITGR